MADEKNFEDRVKKFLKDHGCWFVKYWGGGKFTRAGVPDLLVCCMGVFLAVELKAKNGKPDELQLYALRKIDEADGFGILLYPEDFECFRSLILAIQQQTTIDPGAYGQYQHFRKVRKEWEQKLSVTAHLNSLNYG